MEATINFFSSPKPVIIGAVITASGCATFSFSATVGTALVFSGLGLVISTLAIAIFKIFAHRDKDDFISQNQRAICQLKNSSEAIGEEAKTMRTQLKTLAALFGINN